MHLCLETSGDQLLCNSRAKSLCCFGVQSIVWSSVLRKPMFGNEGCPKYTPSPSTRMCSQKLQDKPWPCNAWSAAPSFPLAWCPHHTSMERQDGALKQASCGSRSFQPSHSHIGPAHRKITRAGQSPSKQVFVVVQDPFENFGREKVSCFFCFQPFLPHILLKYPSFAHIQGRGHASLLLLGSSVM